MTFRVNFSKLSKLFLKTKSKPIVKRLKTNQAIKTPKVLLVNDEGIIGEMTRDEALKLAEEQKLDLVEVSPLSSPPVCKIMDYGTHLYDLKKKEKTQKKAQKQVGVKTVRLSIRTESHDLQVKATQARRFLKEKHTLKVVIIFRGREMAHGELGRSKMSEFFTYLEDVATIEKEPKRNGFQMTMFLNPIK